MLTTFEGLLQKKSVNMNIFYILKIILADTFFYSLISVLASAPKVQHQSGPVPKPQLNCCGQSPPMINGEIMAEESIKMLK